MHINMTPLLEAVADIAYIAGAEKYTSGNSRADISDFILWAKEFDHINRKVEWGITEGADYMEAIEAFTLTKITPVIIVCSSNGNLTINAETGVVTNWEIFEGKGVDRSIGDIAKFNLEEFKKYYNLQEIDLNRYSEIDILDLGYWVKDGTYEEPEMDWRTSTLEIRNGNYGVIR